MLKNPFSNLVGGKESIKTYDLVRLQGKSYRFIKNYMNDVLAQEQLSSLEWGILGLLRESENGLRYIEIAQNMGVEPPFVTELVTKLFKQNLIHSKNSDTDKRAKVLSLTNKGEKRIEKIEKNLEEKFMEQFSEVSSGDWKTYKEVMTKITLVAEKDN